MEWRTAMTDITELALIAKIKKQTENFDTGAERG
jgi:hypothetical protein